MTDRKRRFVLFAALAGVAGWSIWLALNEQPGEAGGDRNAVAEPAVHAARLAAAVHAPARIAAQTKSQEAEPRLTLSRADLFPEQTWYVPPPPPPPPPYVPPPPPQAPALPFSYMGRWQ